MTPVFLIASALEIFLVRGRLFLTDGHRRPGGTGLVRGGVVLRYPSDTDRRTVTRMRGDADRSPRAPVERRRALVRFGLRWRCDDSEAS